MKNLRFLVCLLVFLPALAAAGLPQEQEAADAEKTFTTASGLQYRVMRRGDGPRVEKGKEVGLHGIGSFTDGTVFWNSRQE